MVDHRPIGRLTTARLDAPAEGSAAHDARLFIPRDAAALAVGADDVAEAIQEAAASAGQPIEIVRTGSRGMLWLEPLVEVEIDGVRHGFGPLEADDVTGPRGRWPCCGESRRALRPSEVARPGREDRLLRASDAPDLCPLRRHRSDFARRVSRHRWLRRSDSRAVADAGRHRRRSHEVRTARTRRRRLPDRHQVEDRARNHLRSEVHRLQRGRGRQRHVRRSHVDGRRPVHADRGDDDRRPRCRREQGLHLRAVRVSARDRDAPDGDRHRAERRSARRRSVAGSTHAFDLDVRSRRGLVRLRRGDGAAREPRRPARHRARETAAAGTHRTLRPARR